MIYEQAFDEVVTFEAYYKKYFLTKEFFIIPYINVGVSNHPINNSNDLLHLSNCYVICEDIALVKLNGDVILDNMELKFGEYRFVYIGGIDLNSESGCTHQVLCKKAWLQTLDDTVLSKDFWIPFDRPDRKANMDGVKADEFLTLKNLPKNIQSLIDRS
jgi:hypothetical protein